MTRSILVLAATLLLGCSATVASEAHDAGIEVFRVFPVFESEGSRRVARRELGCDPCQEIAHTDLDGEDALYLYSPGSGVRLRNSLITEVGVDSGEQGSVAYVALTEDGRLAIESLEVMADDLAANIIDGEIIGVVPLQLFGSRYVVAFAPNAAAAEAIAQRLRKGRRD